MTESRNSSQYKRQQFGQLRILFGLSFVDMMGFAMVFPLLPFYAQKLSASPVTIGWMIASFSIAQLVAAPIWGRVSDRYGRRPALLIGLSASAIAFLVFGLANSLWLLFLSRIVQGAGGGTTGVAQAYVTETVPKEDRARSLGWLSAATNAGVSLGPLVGSLAAHLGHEAPGFFAAGLCFCNAIAAWKWLPESRPGSAHNPAKVRKPVWHAAWMVIRNPAGPAERLIWIYGVCMLAFSLITSVLALWLGARFAIDEKSIGWFFAYYGGLSFFVRLFFLGKVIDRIGEIWAMRVGTVLLATGMLLYTIVPSVWVLGIVIPFVPVGTALMFPAITSLLSHATEPSELGTTMGVAQTFAGIARVVAPLVGTLCFQMIGINAPFLLGGFIVMLVCFAAFRFVQPAKPAPKGAPEAAPA